MNSLYTTQMRHLWDEYRHINQKPLAKDGNIRMNQNQMAELFATSKQSICYYITDILKKSELDKEITCQRLFDNCRRRQELSGNLLCS